MSLKPSVGVAALAEFALCFTLLPVPIFWSIAASRWGDRSELRAAIFSRSGDIRDRDVVDHPPVMPGAAAGLPMSQKRL